jgi:arylsulfatase A-like enzyme
MVPVLIRAPGDPRWASPRIADQPVTILQVAPTLAALLGISAPPAATAPPLP